MEPSTVVNMLKENGIKKVKLFDADSWTVSAFKGTDIELMIGIPNDQLKKLSKSKDDAEDWVKDNVTKHLKHGDVNIRYVSVGNEAFLKSYNGSYIHITFPAMQRIQSAIEKAGHGDQIKSVAPGNFERHWGIFRYDGKAKFQVDFSGKGEDKYPISAKGVRYQEKKWCVLKKDIKNITSLGGAMSYACAGGDCTSLGYGCSCNGILDGSGNASYAFNQYFQINDQSVEACDFDGVANIVSDDPSKGNCFFPVAIYSNGNMLKLMHKVGAFFIIFSLTFTLFM
ncbi:putative glucan endo-1,3-beta-D-glucosidase [Lupinus albus]|uniref:glucan endo-1,3-beta-D-glucosidase n=1 Tax=Lupinus albus TaxID=3870 RepID=A0A6A4Q9K7_LUPAL|nr:putative glucan endo-1,3-beta-D-glucosidase [Lupinus albus]